jgi:hypothetical protein
VDLEIPNKKGEEFPPGKEEASKEGVATQLTNILIAT